MRMFRIFIITIASCLLIWALGGILFVLSVLSNTADQPEAKTEAIVVFTGADNRIEEGLNMFASKQADKILISGVYKHLTKDGFMKAWRKKIALKIPCCVDLGYKAENTIGNASEVKEWVETNNIETLRLITSDYHMPRAYLELSRVLSDVKIYKHPVNSSGINDLTSKFWRYTFTEYHKSIARWLHFNELQTQ